MWQIKEISTYKKLYDFSSSGLGTRNLSVLEIDNHIFLNMIEMTDIQNEEQYFQTMICEECGMQHCAKGNWVAIRSVDNYIFFIPIFDLEYIDIDIEEYSPPLIMKEKGAFWLRNTNYTDLENLIPDLKSIQNINQLSKNELISLFKWEVPYYFYGNYPNFSDKKINIIRDYNDPDIKLILSILDRLLTQLENTKGFEIKELDANDKIFTLNFNIKQSKQWKVLALNNDKYYLILGETFKIIF